MKFQNLRLFPGHLSKNHVSHIIVLPNDIEYIQAFEREYCIFTSNLTVSQHLPTATTTLDFHIL